VRVVLVTAGGDLKKTILENHIEIYQHIDMENIGDEEENGKKRSQTRKQFFITEVYQKFAKQDIHTVLVLDELNNDFKNFVSGASPIKDLFTKPRHINISSWLAFQYYIDIDSSVRTQLNNTGIGVIFRHVDAEHLKTMFKALGLRQFFGKEKSFVQTHDAIMREKVKISYAFSNFIKPYFFVQEIYYLFFFLFRFLLVFCIYQNTRCDLSVQSHGYGQ